MSGYSFYCTPCGISHAGECPPKKEAPAKVLSDYVVEVDIGSRWKGQVRWHGRSNGLVGIWKPAGDADGYEVLAIISDGTTPRSRIQVRSWGQPGAVVWTLPIEYWFEDGWFNQATGCDERMIPWV